VIGKNRSMAPDEEELIPGVALEYQALAKARRSAPEGHDPYWAGWHLIFGSRQSPEDVHSALSSAFEIPFRQRVSPRRGNPYQEAINFGWPPRPWQFLVVRGLESQDPEYRNWPDVRTVVELTAPAVAEDEVQQIESLAGLRLLRRDEMRVRGAAHRPSTVTDAP
jgi:hypothetical protein